MEFECKDSNNSPVWDSGNILWWKLVPEVFGGGKPYIQNFKDAWVIKNKTDITTAAKTYNFPPELLAGVCWIEVGGDPNFIDTVAFEVRSFDWIGWRKGNASKHTITRHPAKTSFGAVSIQLRTAAETLGIDLKSLSQSELRQFSTCLQKDVYNIRIVAQHLRQLIEHDGFSKNLPHLTEEQVRIVGARYNRGIGLSLVQIKQNTSYGDFILNWRPHFQALLK